MAKGVAIPYVIALIIGIVVVGILAYWFLTMAGKGAGTSTTVGCDAQKLSYCQEWSTLGFVGSPLFTKYDENLCGSFGKDEQEKKVNCKTVLQLPLICSGTNGAGCPGPNPSPTCCDGVDKPKPCATITTKDDCVACGCVWG